MQNLLCLKSITNIYILYKHIYSSAYHSLNPCRYLNTFSPPTALAPVTSVIMTPQVSLYREVMDLSSCVGKARAHDTSKSVFLLANVLKASDKYAVKSPNQYNTGTTTTRPHLRYAPHLAHIRLMLIQLYRIIIRAEQCVLIAGLLVGAGGSTSKQTFAEIVVSDTAFDDGHFYFLNTIGYVQVSSHKHLISSSLSFLLFLPSVSYNMIFV